MKAVVYNGARDIVVKTVADARLEQPTDVLVKVTASNICGSDLHTYEGRTSAGRIAFDWGLFWSKGMSLGTGQTPVKAYNRRLRDLIHAGRATPSWIVSHTLAIDDAPRAYKHFDARDQGWTKVVLKPNGDDAPERSH